jgi:putative DNA primase/helicase
MSHTSENHNTTASGDTTLLTPRHYAMLHQQRGIAEAVIAERGYRTNSGHSELKSLAIVVRKAEWEGLLLPLWSIDGTPATFLHAPDQREVPYTIFRPDVPRIDAGGRERKYVNPTGTPTRIDCHPRCHALVRDAGTFLWLTEGIPKGDAFVTHGACALAFPGVENWRGSDWRDVPLKGRDIGIVYDSDVVVKRAVQRALTTLTEYLTNKGAKVWHVYLPHEGEGKTGIDDFLLTHTLAEVEALLVEPRQGTATAPLRPDWQQGLLMTKHGMPLESFGNLKLCVANSTAVSLLWYNLVSDRAMVGEEPLTEQHIEQAALNIEQYVQLPIRKLDLVRKALVAQCREVERDPIKEWLDALPPWDGQGRILTWLPKYTGAPPTNYTGETGRLWLVSMVVRAMQPGCQCRSVIVLLGDEDIGKSKLVETLASKEWYRDVSGSLEGKEGHILMKGAWLVELGELSSMSKTEEARLKSFISMANDEYVPKYSNDSVKQARRTVLVGTMNPEGDKTFLRGQTGNTRYYPLPVTTINLEAVEALRDQFFAEALAYWRDHPTDWWRLTPLAEKEAAAVREDHRIRSIYEEALGYWLDGRTITCWQEICEHFLLLEAKERWKDTKLQKDIAQAMVACGWTQDKQRRLPGYGVVRPWVKKPTGA